MLQTRSFQLNLFVIVTPSYLYAVTSKSGCPGSSYENDKLCFFLVIFINGFFVHLLHIPLFAPCMNVKKIRINFDMVLGASDFV